MNEKIIEKIKKLFALSENNPNMEEAKNAALKAQKLLAQYNISSLDLERIKDETINTSTYEVGNGNKWKYRLGDIVGRNFRCKCFWYGRDTVAFYGYESDRLSAIETFKYLYKVGHNMAKRYESKYRKEHGSANGVFNAYIVGFCEGIGSVLDEQCQALMVVTPKEVEDNYKKMSMNFGTLNSSVKINRNDTIRHHGKIDGQAVMRRNSLAEGVV